MARKSLPPKNNSNKRAFGSDSGLKRGTSWTAPPEKLCIIGGKRYLAPEERGPLDTNDDEDHELFDKRILEPLAEGFILNIEKLGVDTPIIITKIDGIPIVILGKTRVRAARIANKRRKARGEPLITIDCKIKHGKAVTLFAAMIAENEARRNNDIPAKIELLVRLRNMGVSIADAAIYFGRGEPQIKNWLSYEENAILATKKAVNDKLVSHATASIIARIKDPEKQRVELDAALADARDNGGKVTRQAAKTATKNAGVARIVGITEKKMQRCLLKIVQDTAPSQTGKERDFWANIETCLKAIVGDEDVDPRLIVKINEAAALMKTERRAKAQKRAAKEAKKAEKAAAKEAAEEEPEEEEEEEEEADEAAA